MSYRASAASATPHVIFIELDVRPLVWFTFVLLLFFLTYRIHAQSKSILLFLHITTDTGCCSSHYWCYRCCSMPFAVVEFTLKSCTTSLLLSLFVCMLCFYSSHLSLDGRCYCLLLLSIHVQICRRCCLSDRVPDFDQILSRLGDQTS